MSRHVWIRWDESKGRYAVTTPYEARVPMKEGVPARHRSWDKSRRVWWLDAGWVDPAATVLERAGYTVHVEGKASHGPPDWVARCFAACPPRQSNRLRKALMSVFHPDRGGSTGLAQRINAEADRRSGAGAP